VDQDRGSALKHSSVNVMKMSILTGTSTDANRVLKTLIQNMANLVVLTK
jgi:hypothetical protein